MMDRKAVTGMVVGLGTDIIEIARVQSSIDRYGDQFLQRVFTEGEIAYCRRKKRNAAESFAARFAAKEAGAKALGTGISRGVSWREIEVTRAPGERPELRFSGRAAERATALGVRHIALTLTHSRDVAMAVVIVED
jgi:holo-[acyl-carrier protein] synthase